MFDDGSGSVYGSGVGEEGFEGWGGGGGEGCVRRRSGEWEVGAEEGGGVPKLKRKKG